MRELHSSNFRLFKLFKLLKLFKKRIFRLKNKQVGLGKRRFTRVLIRKDTSTIYYKLVHRGSFELRTINRSSSSGPDILRLVLEHFLQGEVDLMLKQAESNRRQAYSNKEGRI